MPNDLQRCRAVSLLKIKIPSKNMHEMHGSRSKIPSKKSRKAALQGGIKLQRETVNDIVC
jgi:hypothetical protein